MQNKQTYWLRASLALLVFVILGYVVRFYPEALKPFDSSIQTGLRGQLPTALTNFFKTITVLGNTKVQIAIAVLAVLFLWWKKWYAEAAYLAVNALLAALCIISLKYLYQRPRPSITHLVHADGFSFPSGHSMGTFLIIGSILVIAFGRLQAQSTKWTVAIILSLVIFLVGLSRIYLGVHYPTDVIAGFTLAYAIHNIIYPIYAQKRFEWRFHSKQS